MSKKFDDRKSLLCIYVMSEDFVDAWHDLKDARKQYNVDKELVDLKMFSRDFDSVQPKIVTYVSHNKFYSNH